MSAYENFIQDFPNRCNDLLQECEKKARFIGREVTLMICIASAGFTIPFERIRQKHPSENNCRYSEAAKRINELLKKNFLESRLAKGSKGSWHRGPLASHSGSPDNWPEIGSPDKIKNNEKVKEILFHLRNALAHGNIYTIGRRIETIIFLSETDYKSGKFNYITVTPDDFCNFLRNWFEFLNDFTLSAEVSTGIMHNDLQFLFEAAND